MVKLPDLICKWCFSKHFTDSFTEKQKHLLDCLSFIWLHLCVAADYGEKPLPPPPPPDLERPYYPNLEDEYY